MNIAPRDHGLLSKREAAKLLQLCPRTIDNLVASRAIAYVKIGKSVRFTREAVSDLIASRTVMASN